MSPTGRNKVTETAWLIERSAGPHWWTGGAWSADSLQAVRFCRKQDAERVIDTRGIKHAVATEHMWSAAAEPEAKDEETAAERRYRDVER